MRIIVAFPHIEDAKKLKNVLDSNGCDNTVACNSGAQAIMLANECDSGIVVCGYKLMDMHYSDLYGYLPREISMLLVASPNKLQDCYSQDIVRLPMPIHTVEFMDTIDMMTMELQRHMQNTRKRLVPQRTKQQQKVVDEAKILLMERNQMTEKDAHRYIQKLSMDSGNSMVETAEMILAFP